MIIIIIIINIIFLLESFSHQRYLMVFHWSLSNSKSPQVSRTLLSILAVPNNAVVWTVSTSPVIFKSSSPCTNPLVYWEHQLQLVSPFFHVPQFFQFPIKFDYYYYYLKEGLHKNLK